MDRYSPLAPAFVRVLLLPVGRIERRRFLGLLDALKREAAVVRLQDVEPRVGDDDVLLSPKAFPQGRLLYNYTTSVPSEHHHQLSPYELFREPLLVVGVVDGLGEGAASGLEELGEASRYLREKHQRVVHRQLLVIDKNEESGSAATAEDVVHVAEGGLTDAALLKDAVLAISARFLVELSTYTRALQASPGIQTPGQTARSLQRSISTRELEKLPPSGRSTPTAASDAGSPVDGSGVRTPPYGRSSPATSFDQIASNAQNALSRSESRASNRVRHGGRASSQDRVSIQGFGSMSQEKLKNRGKARVGIVTGYLHMMAGQWGEALKILVDGTHRARTLNDFLWHAKGMEGVVVCLLLHAWAGIEFQIPTICYPIADRVTAGHSQRFSINLPSDFRTAEAAQKAALHRLSNYLPDLVKQILNLYDSGEASLELPFLINSEATIRCCKLLLVLQRNSELSQNALQQLLEGVGPFNAVKPPSSDSPGTAPRISNSMIANMLSEAQPMADDNVPLPDQVAILAGVASVYTSLGMKRKRAAAMREMVVKLTHALSQARKRGAAEMGIHPAATLSVDNGAEAILAAMELSGGLHQMLEDVAVSYGVPPLSSSQDAISALLADASGNDSLKQLVLTELSAFCEASPDLQGLLRVNTALLKASTGRSTAGEDIAISDGLSREEQIRLTSTINRSVGISKHLGLPDLEATYWDPFLVRDVEFAPPAKEHAVVAGKSVAAQPSSTNPLLYDPNASRPGTAASAKPAPAVLVQGDVAECVVKLQNPFEVAVEIESLSLVTEGAELSVSQQAFTLGPSRVQEVSLWITPTSTGKCKVTACRVKISGCREQDFPIFQKPWAAPTPLLIKNVGQEAGVLAIDRPSLPAQEVVTSTVIEAQPLLTVQSCSPSEEGLMLLDGESAEMDVVLKNVSTTAASLVNVAMSNGSLALNQDATGVVIPAEGEKPLKMLIHGKAGISHVQANIIYGRSDDQVSEPSHVRALSVSMDVTVNASLQLQNLDILQRETSSNGRAGALTLSLDIGNAWPKTLDYECAITAEPPESSDPPTSSKAQGTLAPGQVQRMFLTFQRPFLPHDATAVSLRDALLQRLTGRWSGDGRNGRIDFSRLRPSADALEALRSEPVELHLDVLSSSESPGRAVLPAGAFAVVVARISTSSALPTALPLVVHFQPGGGHAGADVGVEERRFAVAGAQHRVLPPLGGGGEMRVEFALCPLLAGRLEVDVMVRPARMLGYGKEEGEEWCVVRSLEVKVV